MLFCTFNVTFVCLWIRILVSRVWRSTAAQQNSSQAWCSLCLLPTWEIFPWRPWRWDHLAFVWVIGHNRLAFVWVIGHNPISILGSFGSASAWKHRAVEPRRSYGNLLGHQVAPQWTPIQWTGADRNETLPVWLCICCWSSSQVLYFICKNGHQLINSTEILKWLREILICRNKFLLRNKVSRHSHLSPVFNQTTLCGVILKILIIIYLYNIIIIIIKLFIQPN